MINIETIRNYYPVYVRENALLDKFIIKEYIQLMILDYLSTTPFIRKLTFIGGTCLRLAKGIDRFSYPKKIVIQSILTNKIANQ
jgi:predicted nucleotidyltransferase component of viral defense system